MAVMQPRENVHISAQIRNITLSMCVRASVCVCVCEKRLNVLFFCIYEQRTINFLKKNPLKCFLLYGGNLLSLPINQA